MYPPGIPIVVPGEIITEEIIRQIENTDNKMIYAEVKSTQTVALYDFSTPIQKVGLMRIWTEQDATGKDVEMVNIITETEKLFYKNNVKNNEKIQCKSFRCLQFNI